MNEYVVECRLKAIIRLEAKSAEEAQELLNQKLDAATLQIDEEDLHWSFEASVVDSRAPVPSRVYEEGAYKPCIHSSDLHKEISGHDEKRIYYVTGRLHGDDDDHTRIYWALTIDEAYARFKKAVAEQCNVDIGDEEEDGPIYITDSGDVLEEVV